MTFIHENLSFKFPQLHGNLTVFFGVLFLFFLCDKAKKAFPRCLNNTDLGRSLNLLLYGRKYFGPLPTKLRSEKTQ